MIQKKKGNNNLLAELDKQQEAQLRRLEKLSAELNKVFESLNLNATESAQHGKQHEDRLHGLNLDQFLNVKRQTTKRNVIISFIFFYEKQKLI